MKKVNKKQLLVSWSAAFPALAVVKGMLMRRVGPLLQGVTLEIGTDRTHYRPVAFYHVLLRQSPLISLGLPARIKYEHFTALSDVDSAAKRLRQLSSLPFEGTFELRDVVDHYRAYFLENKNHFDLSDLEDPALMAGLYGRREVAVDWIHFAETVFGAWPSRVKDDLPPLPEWSSSTLERASDRERLEAILEGEVERHALRSLLPKTLTI